MDDLELDEFYVNAAKLEDGEEAAQIAEAIGNDGDCLNALIAAVNLARYDDSEAVYPSVENCRDKLRLESWHKLVNSIDVYIKNENGAI